ncbi:enoyl-CoA hydratase-related protein (plasmid) [Sphingobium sp. SJ10-10]|uniref:enoyl-CoA hydratase-related protein n=1 Tax=Sphingobium sp. SJ10-10 TaxID=3114999 RepID=UPI002E171596|nr:enoyl-CoA hydratase-related protein [Sphingobium sp. SJ10-10]
MKTEYETLYIDRVGTDGRVARITLNRPEKLNAISPFMMGELDAALHDLELDRTARVIILRGAGRCFSTGHDISGPGQNASSPRNPAMSGTKLTEDGRPLTINYRTMLHAGTDIQMYMWRMAKVTIVQAHGFCLAGGMEFAMMADLITASEDCLFGHPGHRAIGVARNGNILPLVVGMRKAKELFYTGDAIDGVTAEKMGMINYAWPEAELEDRTIALADRIANLSADFLAGLKTAANAFYENMGIQSSVSTCTLTDAALANSESAYEWWSKLDELGVREAVRWRDAGYGDYAARSDRK